MKKSISLFGIFICLTLAPGTVFAHGGEDTFQHAMDRIIQSYLKIGNELAKDSLERVPHEAEKIYNQAVAAAKKESNSSKTNEEKISLLREISEHAGHMEHGPLKQTREHFVDISRSLIQYKKKFKLKKGELYVFYCPMKKKSWLQKNKETVNPYTGKKMLKCGNIVDA